MFYHLSMNKFLTAIVLICTITSCATPARVDPAKLAYAQSIQPVCRGERECELMWSAAKQWVEDNTAYRIKLLTSDHLETYGPSDGSPLLAASISKVPNKDGSYRLRAQLWCDNIFGCKPDSADALISLLKSVNAAK